MVEWQTASRAAAVRDAAHVHRGARSCASLCLFLKVFRNIMAKRNAHRRLRGAQTRVRREGLSSARRL